MEIPAVLSAEGALNALKDGEPVIVDGSQGLVLPNPQPEEETRYRQQKRAYEKEKEILRGYIGRATVTADNETKEVFCNIGNVKDAIRESLIWKWRRKRIHFWDFGLFGTA